MLDTVLGSREKVASGAQSPSPSREQAADTPVWRPSAHGSTASSSKEGSLKHVCWNPLLLCPLCCAKGISWASRVLGCIIDEPGFCTCRG